MSRVDTRLTDVAARIRGVEVENCDALKLIERWDKTDTALYLDPPYIDATRISHDDYANDNGSLTFHRNLIDSIKGFRGTVLLSGYPNPLYDELGWRRETRETVAAVSNSYDAYRTECLWINR